MTEPRTVTVKGWLARYQVRQHAQSLEAYSFGGGTYLPWVQFRFISVAASFPVCSKRNPCSLCYWKAVKS